MYSRITVSSRPTVVDGTLSLDKAFPLIKPTTCDTAYFGGIEINMCTWSGCRWPSSIRLSFCAANLRNTSPRCCRLCPNNVFLLHLGMNTTWYLHSHLV